MSFWLGLYRRASRQLQKTSSRNCPELPARTYLSRTDGATVHRRSPPGGWERSKESAWTAELRSRFRANLHQGMCSHYSIQTVRPNRSPTLARTLDCPVASVLAQRCVALCLQMKIGQALYLAKTGGRGHSRPARCRPGGDLDAKIQLASWYGMRVLRLMFYET